MSAETDGQGRLYIPKEIRERDGEKYHIVTLELDEGVARSRIPETKRERILEIPDTKHVVSGDRTVVRKPGDSPVN